MEEIWRLAAYELTALIRARKISAREATQAALNRLSEVNMKLNAVVAHRPEEALAQADAIDGLISKGGDAGILAGVPITVKDNIDQAGYATTNGIRLQSELVAKHNSPVIDNLKKSGAIIIGRTNTSAFCYRWFTTNLLHGNTYNPRNPAITPGGSSGGAGSAVAAGIGHIAHGTDIVGSIRYPAYACGVHGLRPTIGRIPAYNASSPERPIGQQITAVSGPLARTIHDLRIALSAMSMRDSRDPWWVPAPLEGPSVPRRAAVCLRPDGMEITREIESALLDSAKRLERAGWLVEEVIDVPPLAEPARHQVKMWFGESFRAMLDAAQREGDIGALATLLAHEAECSAITLADFSEILTRRAKIVREWQQFFDSVAVLLIPVSGRLPFQYDEDIKTESTISDIWRSQCTQVAVPFIGLPALSVATELVGEVPNGVQIVAGRYREDLCLLAAEAIEASGAPESPISPK